jgi:hypothetical protein
MSPGRAACKSMSRAHEHLAQANGHIAELKVQIVRQRVIVKYALDTGQRFEMAESLLDALEGSLRLFEKHRIFLLSCSVNRPSNGSSKTRRAWARRAETCHDGPGQRVRHDRLTNAALAASFGTRRYTKRKKKAPVVRPGLSPNEKTSRGSLDAPILFQV